jgi:hypothetical protein
LFLMRLVRDHIGLVSWLALVALALNLALSFGHFHAGSPGPKTLMTAAGPANGDQPRHHDDGLPDDPCPICMASFALANSLAAAPPLLPQSIAQVLVDRAAEPVLAFAGQPKAAFRSRAPPSS